MFAPHISSLFSKVGRHEQEHRVDQPSAATALEIGKLHGFARELDVGGAVAGPIGRLFTGNVIFQRGATRTPAATTMGGTSTDRLNKRLAPFRTAQRDTKQFES